MVWPGGSSVPFSVASVAISGEIGTSMVCVWGDCVASFSETLATRRSEMVGDSVLLSHCSGGMRWLALCVCSYAWFSSMFGLHLRLGAYSERLVSVRLSASSSSGRFVCCSSSSTACSASDSSSSRLFASPSSSSSSFLWQFRKCVYIRRR